MITWLKFIMRVKYVIYKWPYIFFWTTLVAGCINLTVGVSVLNVLFTYLGGMIAVIFCASKMFREDNA